MATDLSPRAAEASVKKAESPWKKLVDAEIRYFYILGIIGH